MQELKLCVPCAERLKEEHHVRMAGNIRQKITCEHCNRRRFGNRYIVEIRTSASPTRPNEVVSEDQEKGGSGHGVSPPCGETQWNERLLTRKESEE